MKNITNKQLKQYYASYISYEYYKFNVSIEIGFKMYKVTKV